MSVAAISVTTNATLIIAKNFRRAALTIENRGPAVVWVGDVATVTAATGISLGPLEKFNETPSSGEGSFFYKGAYYGITSAGTADVRVMEQESTK